MDNEDWRDWRVEHEGLTWRVARPVDVLDRGVLGVLLDTMDSRYGSQDRPHLLEAPVILTLVAENAEGEVVDGLYIELVAEVVKFGTNRAAFSAYPALLPHIGSFLAERGCRVVQMGVASRRVEAMRPALEEMGFRRSDPELTHWVRKVRD